MIVFIVGPTAVGKSDVALGVSERINGEIISCDAMQVYKEISIASNKASLAQRRTIAHHLLDVISVSEEFDVVLFCKKVLNVIQKILEQKRTPIIVGGSGLYMKILLDGIFEGAHKDEALREQLKSEAKEKGTEVLYNRLKQLDKEAAKKIHANDLKRIVRALEVCIKEDRPISDLQKNRKDGLWGTHPIKIFGLSLEREELYARINARVDKMIEEGLIKEIEHLKTMPLSKTAQTTIGVQEICGYLNKEFDLEEAKNRMKQNTRRLAKRQMTWFRQEKRIEWIDAQTPKEAVETICTRLLPISTNTKKSS